MSKMTKAQQRRALEAAQKKCLKVWQVNFGIVKNFTPRQKDKLAKICTDIDALIDKLK